MSGPSCGKCGLFEARQGRQWRRLISEDAARMFKGIVSVSCLLRTARHD